ncbi:hypothetical protein PITCH_A290062 [uncultured Desulfobacterium sp.]|uniref:Uncharacterized protein n=1 Tax=uncultured Desulfobacterium sp. TaxID=201089 RepID=A0A445MYX4_9BACT|nr:hypothetical protein PITCH_A290062 [uncultured Desulfobacterium sp.]
MSRPNYGSLILICLPEHMRPDTFFMFGPSVREVVPTEYQFLQYGRLYDMIFGPGKNSV